VDEIWLTFSDPQPKDFIGHRRITSICYWNKYSNFLKDNGRIHIKHDNAMVYQSAIEELETTHHILEAQTDHLYGPYFKTLSKKEQGILSIRTFYESRWLSEGKKIHYLRFRYQNNLPKR
jgi:tRNA (guanine-N7-)-methyltransferase